MGFKMKYEIEKQYLTSDSKRRSGAKMPGVKFMVAHDTGNPTSTAQNNVDYYQRSRNEMSASAHIFVDDKRIIECIPFLTGTPEKAWHVLYNVTTDNRMFGGDANDYAGGVELCFGGKIDGEEAYKRYIWVLAYSCYKFGLNPANSITGHEILDPARKVDPSQGLRTMGRTYSQLLKDIVREYNSCINGGEDVVVSKPQPPAGGSGQPIGEVIITATAVKLRDRPGMDGNVLDLLPHGSPWAVFYKQGDWYNLGGEHQFCTANPEFVKFIPYGNNSGASTSGGGSGLPDGVLKKGASGEGVRAVQNALASVYFYPDKGAPNHGCDGFYGDKTVNAVYRFQSVHCNNADGIYGPETKRKLIEQMNK
ncbi:TPA: N-acetylmuramoyl-L-alanine amidase [Bacillus cereus]